MKVGSGSWTFANAVTGVSQYTFKGGNVILNNTGTTVLMAISNVTVQDSAVMKGIGTITNVRFMEGGTLMPGHPTSSRRYGCVTTTNSIMMYAGSKLNLIVYSNQNRNTDRSYLTVGGELRLNGESNIELGGTYKPAVGDEIIFWTAGSVSGTPTAINLPELPAGLYWDTSDLLKPEGKLRVTDQPTGIQTIRTNGMNDGKIYTLDGKRVEMPLKKGIYIKNGKKFYVK